MPIQAMKRIVRTRVSFEKATEYTETHRGTEFPNGYPSKCSTGTTSFKFLCCGCSSIAGCGWVPVHLGCIVTDSNRKAGKQGFVCTARKRVGIIRNKENPLKFLRV
jgi:hypothetical protein